jgi:hypothetical protein
VLWAQFETSSASCFPLFAAAHPRQRMVVLPVTCGVDGGQILQMLILRGALEETQGMRWWGLMALFPILYAPIPARGQMRRYVGRRRADLDSSSQGLRHAGLNVASGQLVFHQIIVPLGMGRVVVAGPAGGPGG